MGKNTKIGAKSTKEQSMVPTAVMERTIIYLILPCWLGYQVVLQSALGKKLQKRQEGKKQHSRNVLSATRAQHLWHLPLLTRLPGKSCAVYLKEREKSNEYKFYLYLYSYCECWEYG